MADPRSASQRKLDVVAMLRRRELDGWVASADSAGVAHLVPLSIAWDGECILVAAEPSATTTRNIQGSGRARVALGETRDVLMIDAVLDAAAPAVVVDDEQIRCYIAQAGWDPRNAGVEFMMLRLRPLRIQAWRDVDEIGDRTLMRSGDWLVD